jgi:hypothetical protein
MDWNHVAWKRSGAAAITFAACLLVGTVQADEITPFLPAVRDAGTKTLHFPHGRCVGDLYVEPESASGWDPKLLSADYNWEYAGLARGDVAVPGDRAVHLTVMLRPRPRDLVGLSAQDRQAGQTLLANRARVDPNDLSGLSELRPDDLCRLLVCAVVPRRDADRLVLEPIERLTGLQMLTLQYTGVTPKGMEHLRALRALRALELSGERSVGSAGLAVLKDLPALEYLNLDVGVTDAGLKEVAQARSIRWLRIRTGSFWGPGLAELAQLPRLEHLCLEGHSALSDAHLRYLEGLPHLKSLTIWGQAGDRLTNAGLASIGKLKDLGALNFVLTSPRFTPAGIAHLKDLKNLKEVDFAGAWIIPDRVGHGDEAMRQLAAVLPGLESIRGTGPLSAEGVKTLAAFRNLRRLHMSLRGSRDGYHGPTGLSSLEGLSTLEELSFVGGESLSDADLAGIASLRHLKVLTILDCPQLTDQGLASICKLERLEQLNLWGTRVNRNGLNQLNDLKGLRDLNVELWAEMQSTNVTAELPLDLSHLQGLKRLRLSGFALQEADMASLANLRHLELVILGGSSLPGTSLRYFTGLPELVHLSVDGLSRVTGEDLVPLAGLPKVETLRLGGDVADAAVASLDGLLRLRGLDVVTAAPIRKQTLADLEQRLPTIQYIHIMEPPSPPTVAPQRPAARPQPVSPPRRRGR